MGLDPGTLHFCLQAHFRRDSNLGALPKGFFAVLGARLIKISAGPGRTLDKSLRRTCRLSIKKSSGVISEDLVTVTKAMRPACQP